MKRLVLASLFACSGSQRAAAPPPADAVLDARADAAPPGDAFVTSLVPVDADPNAVRIVVNDHEGPCGGMIIVLDRIYFAAGSSEIQSHQLPTANAIADTVACVTKEDGSITKLEIQGHADDRERDPQRLSEDRAVRIANHLTSRGVPARILAIAGYGKQFPLDKRKTARARANNRRVDFLILERKHEARPRRARPPRSARRRIAPRDPRLDGTLGARRARDGAALGCRVAERPGLASLTLASAHAPRYLSAPFSMIGLPSSSTVVPGRCMFMLNGSLLVPPAHVLLPVISVTVPALT